MGMRTILSKLYHAMGSTYFICDEKIANVVDELIIKISEFPAHQLTNPQTIRSSYTGNVRGGSYGYPGG